MRLFGVALRCCRWISPLPSDSGQRLNARGVEFGRNVSRLTHVHCGDVMHRSGAATTLAVREEITTAALNGSWMQSALESGSLLSLTTSKFRALKVKASKVEGECAWLSPNSTSDVSCLQSGKQNRTMSAEGCGAGELRKTSNGAEVSESKTLEMKVDCDSSMGNGSRECRSLRNQSQGESSAESGLYRTASSLETDWSISQSSYEKSSYVEVRNSSLNSRELANDIYIHDSVARFASQSRQVHSIANATEASLQSEVSKLMLPTSVLENGAVENASKFPVPLTPFSGEIERAIECERAKLSEAAMKSGLAISRSDILFEDEWLMVINKPCGIYSEHVLATIPSLLQTSTPLASESSPKDENVNGEEIHLHLANRLDRDTTGVMVITKCKKAAGKMSRIFTTRWVQKSYLALCAAPPPTWKHLTVESGHGRSRFGAWRVYAKEDIGRELPGKCVVRDMKTHFMVVAVNKEFVTQMDSGGIPTGRSWWEEAKPENKMVIAGEHTSDGLPFVSDLSKKTPLENLLGGGSLSNSGDEVLIRAFPFTGRTHQIRLHCQYIGMSLRGDVKYGGPHIWNGVQYNHHALHAETLSFSHPFTSEKLFLVAPLPQWAKDVGVQTLKA